jgi:hypothetical protein
MAKNAAQRSHNTDNPVIALPKANEGSSDRPHLLPARILRLLLRGMRLRLSHDPKSTN